MPCIDTSHMATWQPSATSRRTSSRPIPEPPPVTTAILPEKSFIGFFPVVLFSLDARHLDHLRPLFGGLRDDGTEFRRRATDHHSAELLEPGLDLRIGEAGIELLVQAIDDVGRGVLGYA